MTADAGIFLGPGGADMGRVVICSGGSAFPLACGGSISSRLTGMPSEIRCCLRIRDLVQFGGFVAGGALKRILYSSRLQIELER